MYSSSQFDVCDRHSDITDRCILVELVRDDVINWENDLDIVLLSLLDKRGDFFRTSLIEERVADLHCIFSGGGVKKVSREPTEIFSSVFLNVNAIPPQMIKELTYRNPVNQILSDHIFSPTLSNMFSIN
jgi:hypothetical protein